MTDPTQQGAPGHLDDSVDTDRFDALTDEEIAERRAARGGSAAAVSVLLGWTRDEGISVDMVAAVLAGPDPEVDAFLAGHDEAAEFGRALLGGAIFELGWALEETGPVAGARWVALARLAPESFVWHVPPPSVLPLEGEVPPGALEEVLLPWVDKADFRVAINWLGTPGFLSDDEAADRLEGRLLAEAERHGWYQAADGVEAVLRRGGRWRAARLIERLLGLLRPDRQEARTVQRVARKCADGRLVAKLTAHVPWNTDDALLLDLAERIETTDLLDFFSSPEPTHRAHARGDAAARTLEAGWRAMARRRSGRAREAIAQVIVEHERLGTHGPLGAGLVEAMWEVHGASAVEPLVAVFLSGLRRSPAGDAVEQGLLRHPEEALVAALGLLPDWLPGFDASAMERLAFRLLPKLDDEARERVREAAETAEGLRRRIVLDEI